MPKYKITDTNSGLTIELTGDSPPSDEELEDIFDELAQNPEKEASEEEASPSNAKKGTVLAPFLLGGLIGAGTMLLVSRSKSKKTAAGQIRKLAAGAREQVTAAVEKGKEGYEKGVKAVSAAVQKGKSKYAEQKEKIAEKPAARKMIQLAAGSAIGAGLSSLLLSEKGKEVARDVAKFAITTGKRMSDIYSESKSKVSDTIEAGKKKIQEKKAA